MWTLPTSSRGGIEGAYEWRGKEMFLLACWVTGPEARPLLASVSFPKKEVAVL